MPTAASSPFCERRADPTKVVFFLDGGGACFDAETCAFTGLGRGGAAPGHGHGILEWPRFYEMEVNGEKLVDWLRRLVEGEPVDDVHCERCSGMTWPRP